MEKKIKLEKKTKRYALKTEDMPVVAAVVRELNKVWAKHRMSVTDYIMKKLEEDLSEVETNVGTGLGRIFGIDDMDIFCHNFNGEVLGLSGRKEEIYRMAVVKSDIFDTILVEMGRNGYTTHLGDETEGKRKAIRILKKHSKSRKKIQRLEKAYYVLGRAFTELHAAEAWAKDYCPYAPVKEVSVLEALKVEKLDDIPNWFKEDKKNEDENEDEDTEVSDENDDTEVSNENEDEYEN